MSNFRLVVSTHSLLCGRTLVLAVVVLAWEFTTFQNPQIHTVWGCGGEIIPKVQITRVVDIVCLKLFNNKLKAGHSACARSILTNFNNRFTMRGKYWNCSVEIEELLAGREIQRFKRAVKSFNPWSNKWHWATLSPMQFTPWISIQFVGEGGWECAASS